MPGKTKKDLYLAKSMTELNKSAEIQSKNVGVNSNPKLLVKTAPRMLKQAEESELMGDDEKAYVLYMRYFNLVMIMKKTADYKKDRTYYDNMIGQKNLVTAMDKAELLSKSLKERYDFMEAKAISEKLAAVEPHNEDMDDLFDDENSDTTKPEVKHEPSPHPTPVKEPEVSQTQGQITAIELYTLLKKKDAEFVMMDVRTKQEFAESHIKHPRCISVPAEALPAGTTVTHIEKALPQDSKSLWQQRQSLDTIVLLDWQSTLDITTIGTPLRTLKDALYKYDSTVILKREPVVLEGGYDQWLLHYPMLSTNPQVKAPISKSSSVSTAPSLDFDYPDDDAGYFGPPKPPANQKPPDATKDQSDLSAHLSLFGGMDQSEPLRQINSVNGDTSSSLPKFDRSTKPKANVSKTLPESRSSSSVTDSGSSLYPSVTQTIVPPANNKVIPTDNSIKSESGASLDTKSSQDLSKYSEDLERERKELEEIRKQKAQALEEFQQEKQKISRERQARISQLKQEEHDLQAMEMMKQSQSRDLADLMRKKKHLQDKIQFETNAEEEEKLKKFEEESARQRELRQVQIEENERKNRQEQVEKLRMARKNKEEENRKSQENDDALARARERARREEEQKQAEVKRAAEQAEKLRQQQDREAQDRAQREREQRDAEARRSQLEKDAQAKKAEEERRRQQDLKEREKIEQMKQEKEKRDQVERERMEQAIKMAEEKMKRMNDKPQVRTIPSPNLPVGWEKMWDKNTGRYFYVDHRNNNTQWEPPVMQTQQPAKVTPQRDTFKAKLKDDTPSGSSGLKRSLSTPNIAQMFEDEAQEMKPMMPTVDRSKKPSQRTEEIKPIPQQRNIVRNFNPVYGNVGSALTGLKNLGNTCYMNSIIQCLNNTAPLVQYFLTDRYLYDINRESILGSHGEVADEFAVIIKALWKGQYRSITPRDFKFIVGKHQPMFAGNDQQDSQEFLTFLMDGLHEGLNKVVHRPKIPEQDNDRLPDMEAARLAWKNHCLLNESVIVDFFQGQLKSTLTCLTCNKQSVTFQAFMYLSLPIPSGSRCSLQDCLKQFLKKESMTGSSRWKCPRCRVERDSQKKIDIWKLPPILIIALNRFVYEGMWRQKVNAYVDFPVNDLGLDKFVEGPSQYTHYQLYGVSNHYGTMDGGHYTAYCKNTCTKRWYKFDDHEVFEMPSSDVKTSAGFVLFYSSIPFNVPTYRQQF